MNAYNMRRDKLIIAGAYSKGVFYFLTLFEGCVLPPAVSVSLYMDARSKSTL